MDISQRIRLSGVYDYFKINYSNPPSTGTFTRKRYLVGIEKGSRTCTESQALDLIAALLSNGRSMASIQRFKIENIGKIKAILLKILASTPQEQESQDFTEIVKGSELRQRIAFLVGSMPSKNFMYETGRMLTAKYADQGKNLDYSVLPGVLYSADTANKYLSAYRLYLLSKAGYVFTENEQQSMYDVR